jgi:hypothetical protein
VGTNLIGSVRGLPGKILDFLSDNCKSAAGVPGSGGFDRRVERKEIGLFRNRSD